MNRIGIITALIPEAACLIKGSITPDTIISLEKNICLYVCGIGAERARDAAHILIKSGMDVLVSWGTAGAVVEDIKPGDLLIPESIVGYDGTAYHTAKHWRSAVLNKLVDCPCDIYMGQLADSMRVLTTADEKTDAAVRSKTAMAVDMESAAIAEIAREYEKPFIAIRVISDSKGMQIPEIALKITDHYGRIRPLNLLQQLISRPHQIPRLIDIATGFRKAEQTLNWIGQRLKLIFP